jgi:hypothetical protein
MKLELTLNHEDLRKLVLEHLKTKITTVEVNAATLSFETWYSGECILAHQLIAVYRSDDDIPF